MIIIPGVIGFILGLRLPKTQAYVGGFAAWAAIAVAVAVFGLAGEDGSFWGPAAIALALAVCFTWAGVTVRSAKQAKAAGPGTA